MWSAGAGVKRKYTFVFLPGTDDGPVTGVPLGLLRLPPAGSSEIKRHLTLPGRTEARLTQDGNKVTAHAEASESETTVAWVCKACQMVFPSNDAVESHWTTSSNSCEPTTGVVVVLQVQYACLLCDEQYPTLDEFAQHCLTNDHQEKRSTDANANHQRGRMSVKDDNGTTSPPPTATPGKLASFLPPIPQEANGTV